MQISLISFAGFVIHSTTVKINIPKLVSLMTRLKTPFVDDIPERLLFKT